MGGKSKRFLKEEAVPNIFGFAPEPSVICILHFILYNDLYFILYYKYNQHTTPV